MDVTEGIRKVLSAEINQNPNGREVLESRYGQVWDTEQLSKDFSVTGFMAPFVVVKRKEDGAVGSMEFQHDPRFYYNFVKD